jgi:F0F1-type ATP synthase assembly protein I
VVARDAPGWSTLLGMGFVTAMMFAAGLTLGWFADNLMHTFPIFALVGLALGIAAGIYYTVVQFRSFLKD